MMRDDVQELARRAALVAAIELVRGREFGDAAAEALMGVESERLRHLLDDARQGAATVVVGDDVDHARTWDARAVAVRAQSS